MSRCCLPIQTGPLMDGQVTCTSPLTHKGYQHVPATSRHDIASSMEAQSYLSRQYRQVLPLTTVNQKH